VSATFYLTQVGHRNYEGKHVFYRIITLLLLHFTAFQTVKNCILLHFSYLSSERIFLYLTSSYSIFALRIIMQTR